MQVLWPAFFQIASALFCILLIFTKSRFMKNYNYLCWKYYLGSLSPQMFLKALLKGLVKGELTQPITLKHLVALEKGTFLHCQLINVLFFLYSLGVLKVGRVHFLICFKKKRLHHSALRFLMLYQLHRQSANKIFQAAFFFGLQQLSNIYHYIKKRIGFSNALQCTTRQLISIN